MEDFSAYYIWDICIKVIFYKGWVLAGLFFGKGFIFLDIRLAMLVFWQYYGRLFFASSIIHGDMGTCIYRM
jgi:hypothetical protein